MISKSLFEQNLHLRNAQDYTRALRVSVISSIAIAGVKIAVKRAFNISTN
jgi:hypothetical protein